MSLNHSQKGSDKVHIRDGTLNDIIGDRLKWPPPSNEKAPWSLKEEAATKKQILDQTEQIKTLQRKLDEAMHALKGKQSQEKESSNEQPEEEKQQAYTASGTAHQK